MDLMLQKYTLDQSGCLANAASKTQGPHKILSGYAGRLWTWGQEGTLLPTFLGGTVVLVDMSVGTHERDGIEVGSW